MKAKITWSTTELDSDVKSLKADFIRRWQSDLSFIYLWFAEDAEDENESDLDLMPEDDQVIFQCSEPAIQYEHSNGAGDVQHLEAAVGQLMSNGGEFNQSND